MDGVADGSGAGMNRRDLLKRGAIVGAAAVWTVPLVQVVSMTPAHADSTSAPKSAIDPSRQSSGQSSGTLDSGHSVADAGASGELAQTGTAVPIVGAAAVGVAALAIGTGLAASARRRRADEAGEPEA
jgi:hypothetical protein